MFSPVLSTKPRLAELKLIDGMVDESGVSVMLTGKGRDGQWELTYADPGRGLTFEFSAYHPANAKEIFHDKPPTDFWRVSVVLGLKQFAGRTPGLEVERLLQEVAANIAECLFRWPMERFNPFQAKGVEVVAFGIGRLSFDLPEKWKVSNG